MGDARRTAAPRAVLLALAFAALVAAPVGAQVFTDSEVQSLELVPGEPTKFNVTFSNPTERTYSVIGSPSGNLSRSTDLEPRRFTLGPDGTRSVNVTITAPPGTEFISGDQVLRFAIVDRATGQPLERVVRVHLSVQQTPLLMGVFENPLPAPLTSGWGMFFAEFLGWVVVGFLAVSVLGIVVHRLAPEAQQDVQDEMTSRVKAPIWYLIVVLGINFSWRLVPASPVIEIVDRMLNAVAIVVAAMVAYRATGAGLYYYGQNVAHKTDTQVDDLLVPVLEKLTAALIVGLAAFYTFRILGVDLSFLVAGGLVAGLVISMAAQDTLSNFFSGIFILVDRPFREGDDIELETGEICRVDTIGLRSCKLYHYQKHQQMILPNNDLATKRVINLAYPDRFYRILIDVGVAYDSDLRKAIDKLLEVADTHGDVLRGSTHKPSVFVRGFGDSAIDLQLRVYVPESKYRNRIGSDLRIQIHKAFADAGIEIPFPQRVVWHHDLTTPQANGGDAPSEQLKATLEGATFTAADDDEPAPGRIPEPDDAS